MCLELKDNKYIRIDHLSCDDIEKEIKIKYPDIEIGTGIINEYLSIIVNKILI